MGKTISVYACGGFGINIGKKIEAEILRKLPEGDNTQFADVKIYYIDTSDANMKKFGIDTKSDNFYTFKKIDGSGSQRSKNAEVIDEAIMDIVSKFRPSDLNIVLHSLGGGSGSVAGPLIAGQLLRDNKLVVCMATQVTDVVVRLRNTVRTLETLENMSSLADKVLPVFLCDNTVQSESEVDESVCKAFQMLSVLFSGYVDRLDTADLFNWINYNNVSDQPIGTVLLDVSYDAQSLAKSGNVMSVATLAADPDTSTRFPTTIDYQAVGFLKGFKDSTFAGKSLHFALIDGPIQNAHDVRSTELEEAERSTASAPRRVSIGNKSSKNGLSL